MSSHVASCAWHGAIASDRRSGLALARGPFTDRPEDLAGYRPEGIYEILDGVRRAKAALLAGKKTVPVNVVDESGRLAEVRDVSIAALRSPRDTIDASRPETLDRFMTIFNLTLAGWVPPPLHVQVGRRGTPVAAVRIDMHGE